MPGLVVFHTSDLHNKLTPEMAAHLGRLRSSSAESLMLDSGDALKAGNIYWLANEPILGLMNSVPYDAMCMGNREYHFLRAGIAAKTAQAGFPMLSANLRPARAEGKMPAKPWVVFNRAGLRVGVLGLTVPCVTKSMMVKRLADYYFENPIEAAKSAVPEILKQCDMLIALTHLPSGVDRDLAARVPGINIILAGHSHTVDVPESVGETTILRHGAYARHVGRVCILFEEGRVRVEDELIRLGGI